MLHVTRAALGWRLAVAVLTVFSGACGSDGGTTSGTPKDKVVVACAADGTCPAGKKCENELCVDGVPADAGAADGGASDDGGAAADAGGTSPVDAGGSKCDPTANEGPSPRGEAVGGMIGGRFLVLYGDDGVPQNCNPALSPTKDAFVFDPCTSWAPLKGNLPPPRARAASAVDGQGGYLYVYGGRYREGSSGSYTVRKDLWRYNANDDTWLQLSATGPDGRSNTALGFRASDGTLWLFGGNASNSGLSFAALGDTWRYTPSSGVWEEMKTKGAKPSARLFHAGAVTGDDKYFVVMGGGGNNAWTGPFYNDTYRLDLETLVWTKLETTGPKPMGRIKHGLIGVPGEKRLLLFGGHDDGAVGNRNDMWWLDVETGAWERIYKGDLGANGDPTVVNKPSIEFCKFPPDFMLVDKKSPERREAFLWNFDIVTGKIWMFGGKGDCGPLRDVWTLDPKTLTWAVVEDTTDGWSCERWISPCSSLCN